MCGWCGLPEDPSTVRDCFRCATTQRGTLARWRLRVHHVAAVLRVGVLRRLRQLRQLLSVLLLLLLLLVRVVHRRWWRRCRAGVPVLHGRPVGIHGEGRSGVLAATAVAAVAGGGGVGARLSAAAVVAAVVAVAAAVPALTLRR